MQLNSIKDAKVITLPSKITTNMPHKKSHYLFGTMKELRYLCEITSLNPQKN